MTRSQGRGRYNGSVIPSRAGHEAGATLRLAGPVIFTQIGQFAMGLVDTLMVGPLGAVALASVSFANGIYYTSVLLFGGVILALDPIVAQAFGAGTRERCGEALWSGLWLAIIVSVPLTVAFLHLEPLLGRLGQDPEVVAATAALLRGRALSIPAFLAFAACRSFLNGIGDVRPVLWITALANGLNALVDWVLVYGKLGVPALGVAGLGYSSAIVRTAMLVAAAAWIARRRYRPFARGPRFPGPAALGRVLRLGLPIGGQIGAEVGVFSAVAIFMGWIGPAAQGAHQVALQLAILTFMVPQGIGIAASIRVGQAIGRGDLEAAARAGRVALLLGTAFMAACALVLASFPHALAGLFTDDAAVVARAAVLIRIAAAFQVFDGAQAVGAGCLRGAGDTRAPLLANLVSHWGLGLPLGYALAFRLGLGAPGLWWGLTTSLATVAVLLVLRFLRLRMRALSAPPAAAQ